jgi:hypothetical protein
MMLQPLMASDYLGQRHAGITLRELGRHVGEVEYPPVSFAIARFEKRLKTDRSLEKSLKQVILRADSEAVSRQITKKSASRVRDPSRPLFVCGRKHS